VRNSLDHGLETPEARLAAGKPAAGTITLTAMHQGGSILIEVSDDGAGLSRERILGKARERGLPAHDAMTDAEVWQLIFEPGFSTAEQVTNLSGRGVGMDVVRRNVESLRGRIDLSSVQGKGTQSSFPSKAELPTDLLSSK
jgi:two-component system chemotaxis sensor kinase CheA